MASILQQWKMPSDMSAVDQTRVFSGGACNIRDKSGTLLRNTERDPINKWLTEQDIMFFDPQIHPDTHGTEYVYEVHHPLEIAARGAAKINLYEVSPRTFGGVTSFEIAADQFREREPMVIYYSDGNNHADLIPRHSERGHPLFEPYAIHSSEDAAKAHYKELIKNANNMRKYLVNFARTMNSLTVTYEEQPLRGDIVVTPDRMHAADLFEAVVRASSGERVFVNFTGGERARDKKGNPMIVMPDSPPEVQMMSYLDQYVDEGNQLRRKIVELVEISVFVRVVYTQKSAILALEEVLTVKGLLPPK